MCARTLRLACVLAVAASAAAVQQKWSSFGFGRRTAPQVGRCYTICPPVVYPWGHDPYYDSPYYIHEQELHGGPYGVGSLNPWSTNESPVAGDASHPVAGHWPGIRRPVIPMQLPTALPESNPFPQLVPVNMPPFSGPSTVNNRDLMFNKRAILEIGGNPADFGPLNTAFLERAGYVRPSAYRASPSMEAWRKEMAEEREQGREQAAPGASSFLQTGAGVSHPAQKHFMPPCYHVCPTQDAPNPDDDPQGGPFGPEPYYSPQAKRMFRHHGKTTGYGPFHNPSGDPYGGPFGPDPYYTYGSDALDRGSGQGNPMAGHVPLMRGV